ncbi:hypothetical protein [Streptomyces sp. NPDC005533]
MALDQLFGIDEREIAPVPRQLVLITVVTGGAVTASYPVARRDV